MRKVIVSIIIALLIICISSCQKNQEAENSSVLNLVSLYDFENLDVTQSYEGYMGVLNIFDRLFDIILQDDGSTKIMPSLCKDYSVSKNGLTYHFNLKEGIVFSNGSSFTASDVQYTFERLIKEDNLNSEIAFEVLGAEDFLDGKTDCLSGFEVEGDYSFSITLETPNSGFIAELTSPQMSIVDKETVIVADNFGISANDTVGTGPYKLTEWVVGDHLTLEYNERYWAEEPEVKKCIIKIVPEFSTQDLMFQNGDVDILCLTGLDISLLEDVYDKKFRNSMIITPEVGVRYFALNETQKYLSDVRVRKAVQLAIDADSIVKNVFGNYARHEHAIIPKGTIGHNANLRTSVYNPYEAKRILDEAGYSEGEISFELAFDSSDTEEYRIICAMIIDNLKDVGINVTLKEYEESTWFDKRVSGELESYIAGWVMDYDNPANVMMALFGDEETSKSRSMFYGNTDVMNRIVAASGISDEDERINEFQTLEKIILLDDAAVVPLFANYSIYVIGNRIQNMVPFWSGYENTYDLKLVKFK